MSRRAAWWLSVLAKIWPLTWNGAKATRIPVIGRVIAVFSTPLFSGKNLNITYIPINRQVEGAGSTYLPSTLVEEMIQRSSHRVIIHRCTCRDAMQCRVHDIETGCILMGDGAAEIDERIARHVSVEEAIDHFRNAVEDGLIPMTGRVKIDNYIWGVPDKGKLLTVCLCCRCCCTILQSGKYLPDRSADSLVRLESMRIEVTPDYCTGCGYCVDDCFMAALSINENGIVEWDGEACKGCGRCVSLCPEEALTAVIGNVDDAIDEVWGRMTSIIDFQDEKNRR